LMRVAVPAARGTCVSAVLDTGGNTTKFWGVRQ